ncbi:MAG: tRNA (adenosine(37)-N6)-threonylcarbamoyltransferase complex dimerization subunit type 1 TsaB [Bacteroidales bacterium]|nr:tRNA (adenosine(37)-N6)-threonylcarbamoyltransferase complex dimerization subunit type 1 TsaB [Bacteroidales bacterium]MDZ4203684.1 tRNA (adenosine(37)-N6)-threonylcarbamoyltransferase complex dimerization subunit type 1 TsaB [Bacteroidales bacterium]
MALILCIETTTAVCSAALVEGCQVLAIRESDQKNVHSARLNFFIEELFNDTGLNYKALDAVAVSMGPGSYTGLRIGVSTAKGICYAVDKPLIALETLRCMAAGFIAGNHVLPHHTILCPMIDARRMEMFTAAYDLNLDEVQPVSAEIIDIDTFAALLADHPVYFFGDGAAKCREILSHHINAAYIDSFTNSASHMAVLANIKFRERQFEDTAYFEPFYLKDFIAGKPNVKGLFE